MRRLVDTNVWLALVISTHQFHDVVTNWFDGLGPDDEALFCRSTQQSFLRLITTAGVLKQYDATAYSNAEAWTAYGRILAKDHIGFVELSLGVDAVWTRLSSRTTSSPKLWMDSYLAAFAIAGGYQLVTLDAGFRQFDGLDLVVLAA